MNDLLLAQWRVERPDVEAAPLAVLGRLHHAFMRYYTSARRLMGDFGLSMASFDILVRMRIAGAPYRMTAGGLAQSGFVSSGGITQRVDRLVEAGLVERVRDDADRRYVYVQMTDRGREVVDACVGPPYATAARLLTGMTPEERRMLVELLKKLLRSFDHVETTRTI